MFEEGSFSVHKRNLVVCCVSGIGTIANLANLFSKVAVLSPIDKIKTRSCLRIKKKIAHPNDGLLKVYLQALQYSITCYLHVKALSCVLKIYIAIVCIPVK